MDHPLLSPRILVTDLIASSIPTASVFLSLRVDCIGCSMNKFCTLEDVSRHYDISMDMILETLKEHLEGAAKR